MRCFITKFEGVVLINIAAESEGDDVSIGDSRIEIHEGEFFEGHSYKELQSNKIGYIDIAE